MPEQNQYLQKMQELEAQMKALQESNQRLSDLNARQQEALLASSGKSQEVTTEKTDPSKIKTAGEFVKYMQDQILQQVDEKLHTFSNSLEPMLKRIVPKDESISAVSQIAKEVLDENPGISTELAYELAENRYAKQQAEQTTMEEEASKLKALDDAQAASIGQRGTTSASGLGNRSDSSSLMDIFNKKWDEFGMDDALSQINKFDDPWGQAPNSVGPIIK